MAIKYFAVFDGDGRPQGFYPDDIFVGGKSNQAVPQAAIEIGEDDYRQLIANQPLARFVNHQVTIDPPPAPVTPVPQIISDRQFFQALAANGMISEAEALAAVQTGAIPAAMEGLIAAMPSEDQFGARMLLSGATEFRRDHPLVSAYGAANNMTSQQIDQLWQFAASL